MKKQSKCEKVMPIAKRKRKQRAKEKEKKDKQRKKIDRKDQTGERMV